jgi:hypothetical protein
VAPRVTVQVADLIVGRCSAARPSPGSATPPRSPARRPAGGGFAPRYPLRTPTPARLSVRADIHAVRDLLIALADPTTATQQMRTLPALLAGTRTLPDLATCNAATLDRLAATDDLYVTNAALPRDLLSEGRLRRRSRRPCRRRQAGRAPSVAGSRSWDLPINRLGPAAFPVCALTGGELGWAALSAASSAW